MRSAIVVASVIAAAASPALALTLAPGASGITDPFVAADVVAPGSASVSGTEVASYAADFSQARDGCGDPCFGVIPDLYRISGVVHGSLVETPGGEIVLLSTVEGANLSLGGGAGGVLRYSLSGFAGLPVEVRLVSADPFSAFVPALSRSADGDVLTFDYGGGGLLDTGFGDLFAIFTGARGFDLSGGGEGVVLVPTFGEIASPFGGLAVPKPVPVPAPGLLLAAALAALALRARR